MFHFFYTLPICIVLLIMALFIALWGRIGISHHIFHWQTINVMLTGGATLVVLYTTVWNRPVGTYEAVLRPLAALVQAREQPELYREMLMNVFLFFPLGLTLSNALSRKLRLWMRIGVTTLAGFLLSVGVELTQYVCSIGMAETDAMAETVEHDNSRHGIQKGKRSRNVL